MCGPWNRCPYIYIYIRICLPKKKEEKKKSWFDCIFENFTNQDSFLMFFYLKNSWFTTFLCNFCEKGPSFKDFLNKMGSMSKDFWWKSNPFWWHIPVCLNTWVPLAAGSEDVQPVWEHSIPCTFRIQWDPSQLFESDKCPFACAWENALKPLCTISLVSFIYGTCYTTWMPVKPIEFDLTRIQEQKLVWII